MDWQAIAAIGEVLGAFAVVISVIYLAKQIQLNSKLLKSAAQGSVSTKYSQTMQTPAASPENAYVFHHGLINPDKLTPEQRTHFITMMSNTFIQMDYTH